MSEEALPEGYVQADADCCIDVMTALGDIATKHGKLEAPGKAAGFIQGVATTMALIVLKPMGKHHDLKLLGEVVDAISHHLGRCLDAVEKLCQTEAGATPSTEPATPESAPSSSGFPSESPKPGQHQSRRPTRVELLLPNHPLNRQASPASRAAEPQGDDPQEQQAPAPMIEPVNLDELDREAQRIFLARMKRRLERIREIKKHIQPSHERALLHFEYLPANICGELTRHLLDRYRLTDEERIGTMADLIQLAKLGWNGI